MEIHMKTRACLTYLAHGCRRTRYSTESFKGPRLHTYGSYLAMPSIGKCFLLQFDLLDVKSREWYNDTYTMIHVDLDKWP